MKVEHLKRLCLRCSLAAARSAEPGRNLLVAIRRRCSRTSPLNGTREHYTGHEVARPTVGGGNTSGIGPVRKIREAGAG